MSLSKMSVARGGPHGPPQGVSIAVFTEEETALLRSLIKWEMGMTDTRVCFALQNLVHEDKLEDAQKSGIAQS
jgi:hypothetical protein